MLVELGISEQNLGGGRQSRTHQCVGRQLSITDASVCGGLGKRLEAGGGWQVADVTVWVGLGLSGSDVGRRLVNHAYVGAESDWSRRGEGRLAKVTRECPRVSAGSGSGLRMGHG